MWIMYDTQFGNGKKLAQLLKEEFPKEWKVKTGDVKEIDPKKVAQDSPDALILGGAIRMFRGAPKSKKWLKILDKELENLNSSIKYGSVFVTHGLPTDKVQGWVRRFNKKIQKVDSIEMPYCSPLTAKVADQEGPILQEELEKSKVYAREFCKWISES